MVMLTSFTNNLYGYYKLDIIHAHFTLKLFYIHITLPDKGVTPSPF